MMSSGGGGFGSPRDRPLDKLREDILDGVVSVAGLAAYGAALDANGQVARIQLPPADTPVDACFIACESPVDCRIGDAIASALGIGAGQIVEIFTTSGPSTRLWVQEVMHGGESSVQMSDRLADIVGQGALRMRALPTHFPRRNPT